MPLPSPALTPLTTPQVKALDSVKEERKHKEAELKEKVRTPRGL